MDDIQKEKLNRYGLKIVDKEFISVLGAGYIITPEGVFIGVGDTEDHDDVFSRYIHATCDFEDRNHYNTTKGAQILCDNGNIVYFGLKARDVEVGIKSSNKGYGVLFFPSAIETVTDKQKEAIRDLLGTNISRFSKEKLLDMSYGDFRQGEYSEEYVMSVINNVEQTPDNQFGK